MGKLLTALGILVSLCGVTACIHAQTRLATPVIIQRKSTPTVAAGILVFPNSANIDCIAANYTTCDPVTMQNGTNAQGLIVKAEDGTVAMSTESILPIADATSIMGDGTHRWFAMDAAAFIARSASGASSGCQLQGTLINCINGAITTTFNVTQSTGQVLSNILAGSGTVCLQTDNSGNIGKAAAACGTMTNPMTTTGDMIYSSSGSTPARLPLGSSGGCLMSNGSNPLWVNPCAPEPSWSTYTPSVASTSGTVSTSSISAAYLILGKTVKLRIAWSGSINAASHGVTFTLPSNPVSTYQVPAMSYFDSSDFFGIGGFFIGSGINVLAVGPTGAGANFPNGSIFNIVAEGIYEIP